MKNFRILIYEIMGENWLEIETYRIKKTRFGALFTGYGLFLIDIQESFVLFSCINRFTIFKQKQIYVKINGFAEVTVTVVGHI